MVDVLGSTLYCTVLCTLYSVLCTLFCGQNVISSSGFSDSFFGICFLWRYQVKYGIRVAADPGNTAEIGLASVITMGGMLAKPALRPSMPYAGMLITMDAVSIFLREMDKQ